MPAHCPAVSTRPATSRLIGLVAVVSVLGIVLALVPAAPAHAATTKYRVEKRLAYLGYPTGKVDGVHTAFTRRGLCAWRETHGMPGGRSGMTTRVARSILSATSRPRTGRSNAIYVNEHCQVLYQVRDGRYRRIAAVSTGRPGYGTPNGWGRVWRKWAGWHNSSIYPEAKMYDSIYFRRDRPGIALHGSVSDSYVKAYPASHGCVRVRHAVISRLFDETPLGHRVRVYGTY